MKKFYVVLTLIMFILCGCNFKNNDKVTYVRPDYLVDGDVLPFAGDKVKSLEFININGEKSTIPIYDIIKSEDIDLIGNDKISYTNIKELYWILTTDKVFYKGAYDDIYETKDIYAIIPAIEFTTYFDFITDKVPNRYYAAQYKDGNWVLVASRIERVAVNEMYSFQYTLSYEQSKRLGYTQEPKSVFTIVE